MKRLADSFPLQWSAVQVDKSTGRPVGGPFPATVPGDIFSDLLAAGKIPDPYLGLNSERVQWVNDCDWLYRGESGPMAAGAGRTWLEFMGLDYRYAVKWNGNQVAAREGMFSRLLLEVAPRPDSGNQIEVLFSGIPDRWLEKKFPPLILNTEPMRRKVLKTSMSFGWDFAPRLKGCGIWDEVKLFTTGPALIDDLGVRTNNDGTVDAEVVVDSCCQTAAALEFKLAGETFAGEERKESLPVELKPGKNRVTHSFRVADPKLWWPWDQGRPELYRLEVSIKVFGAVSDAAEAVFGFREVKWARNPGSPAKALDWTLLINGRRVFMRGANVVPTDAMAGRRADAKDAQLMELARNANLNAIRLWGGGNRERRVIYDTCDRLGLLVWQEFPVGCLNFGTPKSKKYLLLLETECREIVRQLRNHPSVFMWCGGNEFNVRLSGPAIKVMARVCAELDPARRFAPASPFRGDAHNWLVWHLQGNLEDYADDPAQLVSEFGLQAPPVIETLKHFLPGDLLWPVGVGWTHHHLGRGKMEKYVSAFGGSGKGLEEFVRAGQEAQAYYLQRGIENWRRQKYKKSGALIWQWNDPWPCVSWSVLDYFQRPKLSYQALGLAFQPLLVTAEFEQKKYRPGDPFAAKIFMVNDRGEAFPELEVEILAGGESRKTLQGNVGPDAVVLIGEISLNLPQAAPVLELIARRAGQIVSRNRYDLTHHDPRRASFLARRLFKRWWQFLTE